MEEAVNGAGVMIGHAALLKAHLDRGALVAPFGTRVRLNRALCLWSARSLRPSSPAARVADWLVADWRDLDRPDLDRPDLDGQAGG